MIEVYKHARALIEKGWTKKAFARDKDNNKVSTSSDEACQFCAIGAFNKARTVLGKPDCDYILLKEYAWSSFVSSISAWNDNSTKDQVLAGFDYCIKELEDAA